MDLINISHLRLSSQLLAGNHLGSPEETVSFMCAVQAQDYPMAKWALGVRLPSATDEDIESSLSDAKIIRTHVLRPTWHFVSAADIYWMIDLTAAQLQASQGYRDKQLELTKEIFSKSNRVIEKTLGDGASHTREELVGALNQAGIATDENRTSHLLAHAEVEKLICSGVTRNNKITYALLSARVPRARLMPRDESLAELAGRYFTSRSPATLKDFAWWSGLPMREANLALEMVKAEFSSESIEGQTYWLTHGAEIPTFRKKPVFLLPNFDEFTISYAERSASIADGVEEHMKEISDRGVFRPILVVAGQVVGIWKRTIKRNLVSIEIQPFISLDPSINDLVDQAAKNYARFSGKQLDDISIAM